MVTRARFTADLISTVNANTSALANAVHISSSGDVTVANSITVGGNISGYATNTYVYSTFAQNTAIYNLVSDRIQVANAEALYVTKATALSSNNDIVNLTNDTLQVANAAVLYVTKAGALTTNNAVVNLIDDRLQVANAAVTYVTKATALTANNTLVNLTTDRLQVANAAVTYVTKATALTSNNALVNLINDRIQVANAGVTYLTKSFALTSNNALVNLINDRIQAANVSTTLGTFWPSANVIAYTNSQVEASTKVVNTSIFIASGGENRVSIPYTNTNFIKVFLNGVLLTEDTDYVAANNVHIGSIDPALVAGDVMVIEEFKNHNANTVNRSAGGGGGGGFQGSSYGFASAVEGAPTSPYNAINKYPFSSDTNATEVSDLKSSAGPTNYLTAGQSSATDGYISGSPYPVGPTSTNIEKFPFASGGPAADVGDLSQQRVQMAGQSSIPAGYGYSTGGNSGPPTYLSNVIDKFPFSADSNATDVGDLVESSYGNSGQSSTTHGYSSGGGPGPNPSASFVDNIIQKFPFSSDSNATDVGDLGTSHHSPAGMAGAYTTGQSSDSNGYASGGQAVSPPGGNWSWSLTIHKFPFSSDANATDAGDLALCTTDAAGSSSTTNGYTAGGFGNTPNPSSSNLPGTRLNNIQKFPFSSDTNASDVADLATCASDMVGHQV